MSETLDAIEKNTIGTAHIFSPFMKRVRTGTKISSFRTERRLSGANNFSTRPVNTARINAVNVLYRPE